MQDRRQTTKARRRVASEPVHLHLWNAPPRNHDWIAARIGRG
jgi:hypothetical protein